MASEDFPVGLLTRLRGFCGRGNPRQKKKIKIGYSPMTLLLFKGLSAFWKSRSMIQVAADVQADS